MKVNGKPILLRDPRACRLAKIRANAENRTAANSAATTIIESLSDESGLQLNKDTKNGRDKQAKSL